MSRLANANTEQFKLYLVYALAAILCISVYIRFVHSRLWNRGADGSSPAAIVSMSIPSKQSIQVEKPQTATWAEEPPPFVTRDIFAPLKALTRKKSQTQEREEQPPTFSLRGTIVGGERPLAIIDDRFVRVGDRIGDYSVIRIRKKDVLLMSERTKLHLEIQRRDD
jgi:hypothetical protein